MKRYEEIARAISIYGGGRIYNEGFKSGAEWADAHPKSPWINTKDKLPFLQSLVLVTLDDGSVSTARLTRFECEDCWEVNTKPDRYLELDEVLYWMPIPELPEGGKMSKTLQINREDYRKACKYYNDLEFTVDSGKLYCLKAHTYCYTQQPCKCSRMKRYDRIHEKGGVKNEQ